jgi:hypothetical protein
MKITQLFFSVFFLLLSLSGSAQESYDKIAQLTCECAKKKDIASVGKDELQVVLSICIIEAMTQYEKQNGKKLGVDMTSQTAMQSFGMEIGKRMASNCPDVVMKMAETSTSLKSSSEKNTVSLSGSIKSVDCTDICSLTLTDASGREHKLLWLRYFNGSDTYLADPKKLAGKKVSIKYTETEYYNPKIKDYLKGKEVVELTIE